MKLCSLFLLPVTFAFVLGFCPGNGSAALTSHTLDRSQVRTVFQCFAPFSPEFDIRADAAIAYGVDATFAERAATWKSQGYCVQMMTGSAWGDYSDYTSGKFDGIKHEDEGQVDPQGNVIGHNAGVPYLVPAPSFSKYLVALSNKAIDAGATALYYEEPEFWSRAGYSRGFQKLFESEYGRKWVRPDSSPDAFWQSARLKYLLYKRHLGAVIAGAKEHAKLAKVDLKCYVPTHSLVNYSQWSIVSPESSLMDLPGCDGYIAQVWTGTARTPNRYRGVSKERTFETAFLEYSSMWQMVAPTGRTVYFLADPVEDDPKHTWDDYRANYERTVAASLLFPKVDHFEVMPWPNRVMTGAYPAGSYPSSNGKTTIPESYARELMFVVNALNDMNQPNFTWDCGAQDVGVLVGDSMMFQRAAKWGDNNDLGFDGFYGLALPLVEHGIPAQCVVLEQVMNADALSGIKTLVMSYETMKPMDPKYNDALANWTRGGGHLVYIGDDSDPFNGVNAWWNQDGKTTDTARSDLFRKCGIDNKTTTAEGNVAVGRGYLTWKKISPGDLARNKKGDKTLFRLINNIPETAPVKTSPWLKLQRGPYVTGAVFNENPTSKSLELQGAYLDLFTSSGAVVINPVLSKGQVFLLRKIETPSESKPPLAPPTVLATTARLESWQSDGALSTMTFRGPSSIHDNAVIIQLNRKPGQVSLDGENSTITNWDPVHFLLHVEWRQHPGPMVLRIRQ